jgi:hypothetical protein
MLLARCSPYLPPSPAACLVAHSSAGAPFSNSSTYEPEGDTRRPTSGADSLVMLSLKGKLQL